jgi:hypothetical protein
LKKLLFLLIVRDFVRRALPAPGNFSKCDFSDNLGCDGVIKDLARQSADCQGVAYDLLGNLKDVGDLRRLVPGFCFKAESF